jgi:hypothetical protein
MRDQKPVLTKCKLSLPYCYEYSARILQVTDGHVMDCVYDSPRGVSLFRLIDLSFNRGARGKKMTASSARARLGGSRHLQLQSVSMAREGK